jgi:hypothetical protein
VRNSPSFQCCIDHGHHVVEFHASRSGDSGTFVTFIYDRDSEQLLRHVTGTDEDEVILQSLAWSEKNSLPITTEASERLQGASEDEGSTETEILGNCNLIGKRGIAKITTAAERVARDFRVESPSVNRSIYFPAFVFLLLFTLLLLLSEQFSRFSVPSSMRESGKAIDQAAVEKATLIHPKAVTKRDLQSDLARVLTEFKRRLFGVGLFPRPVEINVSANEERVVSYVHAAVKKITRRLHSAQTELKNHVHSSFNLKIVSRYRSAVNFVTQIHSRPAAFYQLRLAHKIGPFVPHRQAIGGAGLFVHKDPLVTRTNGRSRKKIHDGSRTLERQLANFFLSMWRRGRYALGP